MRVLIVSGIWPPDVGGPASHAPALAEHLLAHGHSVEVVTTAATRPDPRAFPVTWVTRSLPPGLRHLAVVGAVARHARKADVVYATSMIRRAAIGAAVARRPLIVKLVADEAYERERRSGRFEGTLEEFQSAPGSRRTRFMRGTRTAAVRRARRVICPSDYLRTIALGWGLHAERVLTISNPAPEIAEGEDNPGDPMTTRPDGIRLRLGFAGRLTAQKDLESALAAVAAVPGVSLSILGDGPEQRKLEQASARLGVSNRVEFLGGGSRDDVLSLFRTVDASLLSSSWENMPHTVLESLAVGTPVIATAVGGVPEVVRDGENGLLVPSGDVVALAGAIGRLADDVALVKHLAARTRLSVAALAEPLILGRIEALLAEVVG
jgi:glycosyltransferase involved in cell wall biosynthesis